MIGLDVQLPERWEFNPGYKSTGQVIAEFQRIDSTFNCIVLYNVRDTPIDLEIITFILGIIPFKYVPIGANNW